MRTDYTNLCGTCSTRSARREVHVCPSTKAGQPPWRNRANPPAIIFGLGLAAFVVTFAWGFFDHPVTHPGLGLFFIAIPVVTALGTFAAFLFARTPKRRATSLLFAAAPMKVTRVLRGRVLADSELGQSPTGRECVAWFVDGRMSEDVLGDAWMKRLRIDTGDRVVEIAGEAFVDLSALPARMPERVGSSAKWPPGFREARGLADDDVTRVYERVLLVGDEVEVRISGAEVEQHEAPYREGIEKISESEDVVVAIVAV